MHLLTKLHLFVFSDIQETDKKPFQKGMLNRSAPLTELWNELKKDFEHLESTVDSSSRIDAALLPDDIDDPPPNVEVSLNLIFNLYILFRVHTLSVRISFAGTRSRTRQPHTTAYAQSSETSETGRITC